jgi:hypothetical protein
MGLYSSFHVLFIEAESLEKAKNSLKDEEKEIFNIYV